MNKIGILTLYFKNYNYGGQLQAYALCEFLNEIDTCEAQQISFDYHEKENKSLKQYIFLLYEYIFKFPIMKKLSKRKRKFEEFASEIPHSSMYKSINNISSKNYDMIIVGSDQVWNLDYTSDAFFLENIRGISKSSYAASFGRNDIQDILDKKKNALKDFSFLSVRELSAQKILKNNGIESEIVCDPTILLNEHKWKELAELSTISSIKGKYIFVYLLGGDEEKRKKIKVISKKLGLPIVYIPHIHFSFQKKDIGYGDIEVYDAGPKEFLKLIKEAELVITDSFHCCVFSILFQKKFWAIDRETNNENSTNSRIVTLLEMLKIKNRFITEFNCINMNEIDFKNVELELNEYRGKSIEKLTNYLKQI